MKQKKQDTYENIIYRLYDPVEKSFIKRMSYNATFKYNRLATTVLSDAELIKFYKEFIQLKLKLPDLHEILKDEDIKAWQLKNITNEIENIQMAIKTMEKVELQRYKVVSKEEPLEFNPEIKSKLFEKLVTQEMQRFYGYNLTNWFFKHQRRVARKCKKPAFEPFCVLPSPNAAYGRNYDENREGFFKTLQDLGIPHAKVNTYSKDVVFNCEEDYNLFNLTMPEAKESNKVIYYSDMKKKYQDIQTSISQQLENSF